MRFPDSMNTLAQSAGKYVRLESGGVGVYVYPEGPDWFVPSHAADAFLRESVSDTPGVPPLDSNRRRLLERVAPVEIGAHPGRRDAHSLDTLKECWFHITSRCDMACTHCMFSSGGAGAAEIHSDLLLPAIDQALDLGCRMFFFTGGEPFVYTGFTDICDRVLANGDTHVVVLTNAKSIACHAAWLGTVPHGRLHMQVSVDGDRECHDAVRGAGAYDRLLDALRFLGPTGVPVTLAMSVTRANAGRMTHVVELASQFGVAGVHFMWLFRRGRAANDRLVDVDTLARGLLAAYAAARERGVTIDNIEAIRSQVFTVPGTRFDLSNSAWESVTIGPEGTVYPSPALVGVPDLCCGHVSAGLGTVWRESPVLERIRAASLVDSPASAGHPLRFLVGGGDIDHSYHAAKTFAGGDPYVPLYAEVALALIAEHAREHESNGRVGLRCRMGERLVECGPQSRPVMFTHSNCVQSIPGRDSHSLVRAFYSRAAETTNEDILNPVSYGEDKVDHIPEDMRVRSYGCGSPVLDCDLRPGHALVDLGSGTGIECFIAAREVGPSGKVYGIDMSQSMLERAEQARRHVAQTLGFDNVEFRAGLLEKLPLEDTTVDFVISNCVVNLTADKRSVFEEIFRVLKPGGALCISDIVSLSPVPIDMKYNERLRGECLGGAMVQEELFAMMADVGFPDAYLVRRYEYRTVNDHPFYAITYRARKPAAHERVRVMYRGPHASITVGEGETAVRGRVTRLHADPASLDPGSFFVLDASGNVTNVQQQTCCGVFVNPLQPAPGSPGERQHMKDCMMCGAPLAYFSDSRIMRCAACGRERPANASCENGHFVCDDCHSSDARGLIVSLCTESTETDPAALFSRIRSHPRFPVHGPEYHSLVPAAIVAAYRNAGGDVPESAIATAVERGATVAGGSCGFLGACGAALGAGTALSVILGGTPFRAEIRQKAMQITADILGRIAGYKAARCCNRDCLLAISRFVELSEKLLPVPLHMPMHPRCTQWHDNEHCIGKRCPWLSGK
ncbi:MAG: methyltransferase domain-containing protein [Chitinivibrionales bacterium]|nr:methyltransferase domain-containing protein [Chitinivibrionales bacterium]MBD3396110.1 methyltransferase domain-containing protein [Chitinivibrionales bacterium]